MRDGDDSWGSAVMVPMRNGDAIYGRDVMQVAVRRSDVSPSITRA